MLAMLGGSPLQALNSDLSAVSDRFFLDSRRYIYKPLICLSLGCGNADMYGRPPIFPSSSACNFPCAGNPAQVCGGSGALNEYIFPTRTISVGPPAPFNFPYNGTWNYRGCLSYV
jgi:hypothetical protein